jgi:hypothetical protein
MSRFCFDARSQDAIAAAGMDMSTVLAALNGEGPKIRRHIDNRNLHIFAPTPDGRWLGMAFEETEADEEWLLTRICYWPVARPLHPAPSPAQLEVSIAGRQGIRPIPTSPGGQLTAMPRS